MADERDEIDWEREYETLTILLDGIAQMKRYSHDWPFDDQGSQTIADYTKRAANAIRRLRAALTRAKEQTP